MRRYKHFSLGFPRNNGDVLLGYKRRGFGHDLWNGLGGKVEEQDGTNEERYDCSLVRECDEEASIVPVNYEKRAILLCGDSTNPDLIRRVDTYEISKYGGIPKQSEEIIPESFPIWKIPYHQMWSVDKFWFPRFLLGEHMLVYAFFDDPESRQLLQYDIHRVPSIHDVTDRYINDYLDSLPKSS